MKETNEPQVTLWYECPFCGPVDPVPLPRSLDPYGWDKDRRSKELVCPECYEKVEVKS